MEKHKTSVLVLASAVLFYVVFGLIVPDLYYGSPDDATKPAEHATAAVGQVLRSIAPYIAITMAAFAAYRFIQERGE